MIGPGIFTGTFAAAVGSHPLWHLPGAPFFLAALILAASFALAWRVAER
jgi:DHA1 family tetracycline resistance protein-like MFS transporter